MFVSTFFKIKNKCLFQSNNSLLYIKLKLKKNVIQCYLLHKDICIGIQNIPLLRFPQNFTVNKLYSL